MEFSYLFLYFSSYSSYSCFRQINKHIKTCLLPVQISWELLLEINVHKERIHIKLCCKNDIYTFAMFLYWENRKPKQLKNIKKKKK